MLYPILREGLINDEDLEVVFNEMLKGIILTTCFRPYCCSCLVLNFPLQYIKRQLSCAHSLGCSLVIGKMQGFSANCTVTAAVVKQQMTAPP